MENVRPFARDQADHDGPTQPHDAEAENLVGSAILHSATAYTECAAIIDRDDIYQPSIRLIWDVVGGMVAEEKAIHPVTVRGEIERLGRLREVDNGALIIRLGTDYLNAGMAWNFAEQISEQAKRRRHAEHATRMHVEIQRGAASEYLDTLDAAHRKYEDDRNTNSGGPSHLTSALLDWDPFFATNFGAVELLPGKLMAPGQQITIVGDGKAGKSLLVQEWLWRMATGQSFLGDRPKAPVPVLYVDAENGHQDIQDRFMSYGAGPGRMGLFSYASFPPIRPLDTAGGGADLLAMVKECEAQLVCLDTVSRFISGPENDADTWLCLYRHTLLPLKRAGIASVRLDHLGKDGERGARGSSAKNQDVDHVWELRVQGGGDLLLRRTHTRTGIGPELFHVVRHARREGDRWMPGGTRHVIAAYEHLEQNVRGSHEWLVMQIDGLALPNDAGNPRTIAALANAGIKIGKDKIAAAVRTRKNRDNSGSPDGFPETFPEGVPGERSPGTPAESEEPQVKHYPGTSGEPQGTPPSPPSPPRREGKGEGSPAPEDDSKPLCTICDTPLHGYRADRGYDTCLSCDPTTGSHHHPAA
ncbi:AAA family ATPase [Streptomyces sp. H27-C3]|uniref:AAA family ATPase n=1 Tax=Streptomyces sp. H27-C3 TaxID=3046305 RepID=UPI0024BBD225|nr:AAA family ATPase [Streptomyces sp. H27-C3]MDJ0460632.1 AAA family ATPase [Streptomyces sp. H27-C3]